MDPNPRIRKTVPISVVDLLTWFASVSNVEPIATKTIPQQPMESVYATEASHFTFELSFEVGDRSENILKYDYLNPEVTF